MKSRNYTARHGNEEYRDKIVSVHIRERKSGFPYLIGLIAVEEKSREDSDSGEKKDCTENGIYFSDYLVYRKKRRYDIVREDHTVNYPYERIVDRALAAENMRHEKVTGRIDENYADEKHQQTNEYVVDHIGRFAEKTLHKRGHLLTAVADGDHSAHIVVESAADKAADRYRQENDGSEKDTLYRS